MARRVAVARKAPSPNRATAHYETVLQALNEGVYEWNVDDGTTYYSDRVREVLGLSRRQLRTASDWHKRIHPDDRPAFDAALVAHFKRKTDRFECDFRFRAGDGSWRWARQHGVAIRDRRGRAVRMIGSTGDITELKQREHELAEQKAILETTLENLEQGVTLVDANLRTITLNRRFLELLEFPADRFGRGFHMKDAFRFNAERGEYGPGDVDEQVRSRIEMTRRFEPHAFERTRPNGRVIAVRGRPLPGGAGFVTTYTDVTEQRHAEEELKRSQERYELATSAAVEGIYEWDLTKGELYLSEKWKRFMGLDGRLTPAAWNDGVHPEDFPAYRRAVIDCIKGTTPRLELEYRVRHPEGGWLWILDHAVAVRDANGRATRFVGAVSDIHRRKQAEFELRRARDEATAALERQTATAEILRVISQSPTDVQPVFDIIAERSVTLCQGQIALVSRVVGDQLQLAAITGMTREGVAALSGAYPMPLDAETLTARAYRNRSIMHLEDVLADPRYQQKHTARIAGWRAGLSVPLMRGDEVIGVIFVGRPVPGAFTDSQIDLLKTFADQAVIAVENVRLFNETKESLERQTAMGEILKVIASSPSNVQPVLDAVAASAARLCEARDAIILLREADHFRFVAHFGSIPNLPVGGVRKLNRDTAVGRAILEGRQFHVSDLQSETGEFPEGSKYAKEFGYRTSLVTPLMRDGSAIGAIMIRRTEVRLFDDKQVELVRTFADQAVIAIQNVRLFNETKEALERQTATSEILKVIASSPADVQPVFDAIARSATRLIGGYSTVVARLEGDVLELAALTSTSETGDDAVRKAFPLPLSRAAHLWTAIQQKAPCCIVDIETDAETPVKATARARGWRSAIATPMLRAGEAIGVINVTRAAPGAFSEHQTGLLKTFADQAVIAIENVRLFNETKRALERQTATAEILKVIAGSPTDVQPVFDAIADSVMRLFKGWSAGVYSYDGSLLHLRAARGARPDSVEYLRRMYPRAPGPGSFNGRCVEQRAPVHTADALLDPDPDTREVARVRGYRSALAVPLLKDASVVGTVAVSRAEAGGFSGEEVALLQTFAAQAVIAIENVRLFNETKEALEQQTATSAVLRVISSSPNDLAPVFGEILERAMQLCEAELGFVFTSDGQAFDPVAQRGLDEPQYAAWTAAMRPHRVPGPLSGLGRLLATKAPVLIADVADDDAYRRRDPLRVLTVETIGARTFVAVPLLKDSAVIGAVVIYRREVRPFSEKQVSLLQTFGDQAVIAIENARLFNEIQESLEQQKASGEVLGAISSSIADTKPVFDKILESCERLFAGRIVGLNLVGADGLLRLGAYHGAHREEFERIFPLPISAASGSGLAIAEARVVHYPDASDESVPQRTRQGCQSIGIKSVIFAPLLWKGRGLGAIFVGRDHVSSFSEKEIALLKTFADQAVIAIENVRLFNETKEALEQQTATADILKVISASPTDVRPVLEAVASSAARLCEARDVAVLLKEGDQLRYMAHQGEIPTAAPVGATKTIGKDWTAGRAAAEGRPIHIPDILADAGEMGEGARMARQAGYRTVFATPLLRHGVVVGVIVMRRAEVRPFEPRQIALINTFAEQAVIAIENVRLFNETKEALERQTATAEILKVISSSPTDVQPVFNAIVDSCARLFDGLDVGLNIAQGDRFDRVAFTGRTAEAREASQMFPMPMDDTSIAGRAMLRGELLHIEDLLAEAWIGERARTVIQLRGFRSALCAPMSREGKAIGAIVVFRGVTGRFKDQEVALLRTFADQAVIAIENVRLFNETKEALERQTATAEVLKVISSSPTDAQPVFDAIVQSAARLFGRSARIRLIERDGLHLRAASGSAGAAMPDAPLPITRDNLAGRVVLEKTAMQVADTQAAGAPAGNVGRGYRAIAVAPLVRESHVLGGLGVTSLEPGALTEKQMELLQTFADQAVIAIENVRLFKELQQRTEALSTSVQRLTALGEVGQAISSTLDLDTVLKTIVGRAVQLTGLDFGTIYEYDEATQHFELRAWKNMPEDVVEIYRTMPVRLGESIIGRAAALREPVQVADIQDPGYQTRYRDVLLRRGYRAILAVPLLREDRIIGAITVSRSKPGAFPEEIVELLKTFATQSAMAIQNARLFREIEEKGRQLEEASKHKSQFLASMSHELRTPLNAILGFNEMLLGEVYGEVPADMKEPLADIQSSGKHLLRLINNVLDLAKIEAGRMELALGEYSVHDTVESVRSTLRPLAEAKGLDLVVEVPPDLPLAHGDSGRITQCLMNLAGNSLKFTKQGSVGISVALQNGTLTWKVQDTGIGIPPDKIGSLFTEFKQTDATIASEYGGTGLGLSITKKFIEMHGGRIWAESEVGRGSKFIFEVPLRAAEKGAE